jgi:alpha-N-arabinofuranosidase
MNLDCHIAIPAPRDILARHRIQGDFSMIGKTFASAAAFAAITLTAALTLAQAPPARLSIHADQPISKVSPILYGLMTEEINYSYDGGLYAEMVRNRTFRSDWSGIPYWYLLENGDASAKMSIDEHAGPSDALKSSLKLEIAKADAKNQAGVLNVGYWGISLRPNTVYKGSLYAKANGDLVLPLTTVSHGSVNVTADGNAPGPVSVSLVDDTTGQAVATAPISEVSNAWKQYSFSLKTGAIKPSASNHLAITVAHPGTIWLNLVSLFPPTYHDRVNGNRIDLMDKLAAMHPAFLRFPGGNYLEGDHISERFEWKKTIGPLVDRPTHPSPWRYHSTDGLGLLEFLGWCEDLKMEPVLAVYAGYSMAQEHANPGPDLEPYVQDALDEIEYVTGGPDTKWGAVRVKDGHPAPFKLTYVEVGNEDQFDKSGSYEGRYAQFYKAIKAKHPDLQIIATMPLKSIKPDVQDDHYYVRAKQNFKDAAHYDQIDRNGPKIFVGEWATREGSPTPNFGAALGDAAWMTGLERNSDLVVMAAYAPLLVNVNPGGMQWETDLIGYDTMKSYGSPAYYAQVMFASNIGNQTVASKLENAGSKLFYSATEDTAKKRLYLKMVNAASTPQMLAIDLNGAKVANNARLTSLSAHDTQATNSIDAPDRIVPVESTLHDVSSKFEHTLPGFSIQVIQIDLQ